jgi:hypothetical protein
MGDLGYSPDVRRAFEPLDGLEQQLFGSPARYEVLVNPELVVAMDLVPHEAAVIRWLRQTLARTASPYESNNVGVLLVGEASHTAVVDHQLDHCGGGITSGINGIEVAYGEYSPEGMMPGEEYNRAWSVRANMLIDQCTDTQDCVTLPVQGEILTAREAGSLQHARHWFATWPGKLIELVGAYNGARKWVRDIAEAEAFFAEHGEYSDSHQDAIDSAESAIDDALPALCRIAQTRGIKAGALLTDVLARLQSEGGSLSQLSPKVNGVVADYARAHSVEMRLSQSCPSCGCVRSWIDPTDQTMALCDSWPECERSVMGQGWKREEALTSPNGGGSDESEASK